MPHGAPELAAELAALAEASSAALARLRAGDEAGLVALLDARERLVQVLEAVTVADRDHPALAEATRRAVALDTEIIGVLNEQRRAVARQLELLVSRRHSLATYGGSRDSSPVYIERLG
jgi:hypothetical protein